MKVFKSMTALILALVMAAMLAVSAYAATVVVKYKVYVYTSQLTFKQYDYSSSATPSTRNLTILADSSLGSGSAMYHVKYVNGALAYCIQPGVRSDDSNNYVQGSSGCWYNLPASVQSGIALALACGYPSAEYGSAYGDSNSSDIIDAEKWAATQAVIWDLICEYRSPYDYRSWETSPFYGCVDTSRYPTFALWYSEIVDAMQSATDIPSFAATSSRWCDTIELTKDASGNYSASVTDGNGVLDDFNFAGNSGNGIAFSQRGNTLTITATPESAKNLSTEKTYSATGSAYGIDPDEAVLCWYDSTGKYQSLASYTGTGLDPVRAYIKIKAIMMVSQGIVSMSINGGAATKLPAKSATSISTYLNAKKNYIPLKTERTDITFSIANVKDTSEAVTYTFHVIRHSIEASEIEALIQALPQVDGFIYSEHATAVQQAKKLYDDAKDEIKAELSAESVAKLTALCAELERQYDEGMAQIEAVLEEVSKYKDAIPEDITELTDELYQQYGEAIRASGKLYDKLQGWVLTQWNNGGYAEKYVLTNALKLLNRYETGSRKTIGQATDYLDDFMLTNSAFNLTLGSAWNAYPVTFRDITYSKTKLGGEAGLPWNEPGRLRFEIDDPTIFEIKTVVGSYGDRGLGSNGEVYDNELYYLIPLKEGTTTFRVTLTDKTGTFYGQTPEMIVHVNSEAEASIEKLADKLTNINSLPRTTKYDIHYFWQGQEGAPFTFKVNGDNAKVYVWEYLGGGKKTEYAVDSDGMVTVILKDGYNPIEVTADYQGQRVTQTYGLKGKVIDYTITNVTRPGQAPRLGDTIDLKITGLCVPVYKILRIYNPMGPRFVYLTEDLPQQYQLNGNNDQYHIGTMRIVLTGFGTIHLTGGYIYETWMGSKLGSELSQGNTGEIAPQEENVFSVLPDLNFEVADYTGYTGQVQVNTEVETGNTVRAGQKITINLLNLPTDEITAKYPCVTTSTEMKLQSIQTIFGTNIPGLAAVESELVKNPLSGREVSLDPITSITVTIPKDTPAGTYKIYGGYVKLRRGDPAWSITTENLYERQIQDVELTVLPATDYSDIYTTTGDYIASLGTPTVGSVGGEWMALGLARSGRTVPSGYYDNVVKYVKENIDSNGRLDRTKTTENARVILALTAIGKDPTNVGGYNLLDGFYNMKGCLLGQGVNAPIFALLALDSHNYTPTHDDVTRESLVELILSDQVKADGGWALEGATAEASDVDMTAMAIQALAPYYKTNANVKSAVDKALGLLSTMQQPDGGYASWGTVNSESCAQVIVALTALGIDPTVDSRFIKNGISVLDALCSYYVTGGGFSHTSGEGRDGMATEQGYYALAAYYRFVNKQNRLYDMTDVCVTHTFGEWTTVKEATCTEAGSEKRVCSICSAEETRSIEALGHKFGEWTVTKKATCTEKGSQTRTCSVCQATETQDIAALGHSFGKWVVTKEATRTEEGLKTRTCSVCSATETQVIPALGNRPSNPGTGNSGTNKPAEDVKSSQTGDNSQIAMWMSSVMLSAAALVVLTRKRKHSAK